MKYYCKSALQDNCLLSKKTVIDVEQVTDFCHRCGGKENQVTSPRTEQNVTHNRVKTSTYIKNHVNSNWWLVTFSRLTSTQHRLLVCVWKLALVIEANGGVTRYWVVKITKAFVRLFHFVFSIVIVNIGKRLTRTPRGLPTHGDALFLLQPWVLTFWSKVNL